MHREEEIKEGSCDEKRVGDPGCILIQTKGVEDRIEQAADTEERKMFFHSLRVDGVGLWSVGRLVCRVRIVSGGGGCGRVGAVVFRAGGGSRCCGC